MKRALFVTVAALTIVGTACGTSSASKAPAANKAEQTQQGQQQSQYEKGQPIPFFTFSQIRQTLIDVERAQSDTVQTTTFFFNMGVAHPDFVCPSIGFPVPSTSQLSNPEQAVNTHYNGNVGTTSVGQQEPTGVYTGNSTGTYVLCIGNTGRTYAHYAEEFVHTVTGSAHWDNAQGEIVVTGAPTANFQVGK